MIENCLSIITNFGCHYDCPYCIVKNNNLKIPKTTIDGLSNLKKTIIDNNINIVSISGGGDPCYNYKEHIDWYDALFAVLDELAIMDGIIIPIELHTSYTMYKDFPYDNFDRVVYHIIDPWGISNITNYGNGIRVVFVVTEDFTEEKINEIVDINKEYNYELTFRQMVDSNYNTTEYLCEFLEAGHTKEWWYIKQNDYNLYYFENKTSTTYEDFK